MYFSKSNLVNLMGDLCHCNPYYCRGCAARSEYLCHNYSFLEKIANDFNEKGYKFIASKIFCKALGCQPERKECVYYQNAKCHINWRALDQEIVRFLESEDFRNGYNYADS